MDLQTKIEATLNDDWSMSKGRKYSIEELAFNCAGVVLDHFQSTVNYYTAEICYLQQRVEELEIDLMLEHEAFQLRQREQASINPKRRLKF